MTEPIEPRRPTKQRAALAKILEASPAFRSAQELHADLRAKGAAVSLATVYRNLQAMTAEGAIDVLRRSDGEALYRSCRSNAHHHHLVCQVCGRTIEVDGPAVERWAAAVAREHGFVDVTHTVELFGRCDDH